MTLQVLRLNSTGKAVEKWQTFLRGLSASSLVIINSKFDDITLSETKKFQVDSNLNNDGVVGNLTYAAAALRGFQIADDVNNITTSVSWPQKPTNLKQYSIDEMIKAFGRIIYRPSPTQSNQEAIQITNNWSRENIISCTIPQLIGIVGAPSNCTILVHKCAAPKLIELFSAWEDANLLPKIKTWGGLWAPRFIRGSRTTLSRHAWGTAFDINAGSNPLGQVGPLAGKLGSNRELIEVASKLGWYSGMWFVSRPDPMHFELGKIV